MSLFRIAYPTRTRGSEHRKTAALKIRRVACLAVSRVYTGCSLFPLSHRATFFVLFDMFQKTEVSRERCIPSGGPRAVIRKAEKVADPSKETPRREGMRSRMACSV